MFGNSAASFASWYSSLKDLLILWTSWICLWNNWCNENENQLSVTLKFYANIYLLFCVLMHAKMNISWIMWEKWTPRSVTKFRYSSNWIDKLCSKHHTKPMKVLSFIVAIGEEWLVCHATKKVSGWLIKDNFPWMVYMSLIYSFIYCWVKWSLNSCVIGFNSS